jgi:hypothetical protein
MGFKCTHSYGLYPDLSPPAYCDKPVCSVEVARWFAQILERFLNNKSREHCCGPEHARRARVIDVDSVLHVRISQAIRLDMRPSIGAPDSGPFHVSVTPSLCINQLAAVCRAGASR